jgi:hypothetical protein
MEMRLLKAVSLLVDPDAKIIHVAEKCGFNHLGLFNTCFKRRFGASPSQWRKMVTQGSSQRAETGAIGFPLQSQGLGVPSEKTDPSRPGAVRTHPLERVGLSGLLRDIAALKNGVGAQALARKESNGSGYAAENRESRAGAES